ncbi:hypothetical protein HDV05_004702 [Chytridiales sp. JEL 0842]|nr:hypothetical protein HDV05_004702 [Chytridiales sp. JEL 0842]
MGYLQLMVLGFLSLLLGYYILKQILTLIVSSRLRSYGITISSIGVRAGICGIKLKPNTALMAPPIWKVIEVARVGSVRVAINRSIWSRGGQSKTIDSKDKVGGMGGSGNKQSTSARRRSANYGKGMSAEGVSQAAATAGTSAHNSPIASTDAAHSGIKTKEEEPPLNPSSASHPSSAWVSLIIDSPEVVLSVSTLSQLDNLKEQHRRHKNATSHGSDKPHRRPSHPSQHLRQVPLQGATPPPLRRSSTATNNISSTHFTGLDQVFKATESFFNVLEGLDAYTHSASKILQHGLARLILRKVDVHIRNIQVKLVDQASSESVSPSSLFRGAVGNDPDDMLVLKIEQVSFRIRTPGLDEESVRAESGTHPRSSKVRGFPQSGPSTARTSTVNGGGSGATGNLGGVPQWKSAQLRNKLGHTSRAGKFSAIVTVSGVEAFGRVVKTSVKSRIVKYGKEGQPGAEVVDLIPPVTGWEPLAISKEFSTVRLSHDGAIVFGRLTDIDADVELAGFSVYASNLLSLSPRILELFKPPTTAPPLRRTPTSLRVHSFVAGGTSSSGTRQSRMSKQEKGRLVQIIIELSEQLSQLMPSAAFKVLDLAIVLDTSRLREEVNIHLGVDLPDIHLEAQLEQLELALSLSQKTNYNGTQSGWLDFHFFIKSLSLTATHLNTSSSPTIIHNKLQNSNSVIPIFNLPSSELRLKTSLPSLPTDLRHMHINLKDIERGQLSIDWAVDSPRVGIDDKLLLATVLVVQALKEWKEINLTPGLMSSSPEPLAVPPILPLSIQTNMNHPSGSLKQGSGGADSFDSLAMHLDFVLDLITVNHIQFRVFTPSVFLMMTQYRSSSLQHGDAVVCFGIEDVDVMLCEEIFVAKQDRQFLGTKVLDANPSVSFNFKVEMQVSTIYLDMMQMILSDSANIDSSTSPKDRLFRIDSFNAVARVDIPHDKAIAASSTVIKRVQIQLDASIEDILLDCDPLVKSNSVDYFALALAISTLVSSLPKSKTSEYDVPITVGPSAISTSPLFVDTTQNYTLELVFGVNVDLQINQIRMITTEPLASGMLLNVETVHVRARLGQQIPMGSETVIGPKEAAMDSMLEGEATSDVMCLMLNVVRVTLRTFNDMRLSVAGDEYGEILVDLCQIRAMLSVGDPADVELESLKVSYNFRKFYIGLESSLHLIKLAKVLKLQKSDGVEAKSPVLESPRVLAAINVKTVHLSADFPEGSQLFVKADPIKLSVTASKEAHFTIPKIDFITTVDGGIEHKISNVDQTTVSVSKLGEQLYIKACMDTFNVVNPHGFEFNGLFEDFINTYKGMKNTVFQKLGIRPSVDFDLGRTKISAFTFPNIEVFIGEAKLQIDDDPFEYALSRNYRHALHEQQGRLARDKAFVKKAASLRMKSKPGDYKHMTEIENAWWLLQEFNSKTWVQRINEAKAKEENAEIPALFSVTMSNVKVAVALPTLPAETLEESIHLIDPLTPANIVYSDIVPLFMSVALEELSVQLRDYPIPLINIPKSGTRSWKTEGILLVAEPSAAVESERLVKISLSPLLVEPVSVIRIINPPKIYTRTRTVITTSSTIFLAWGASLEPPLADVIRILDSFTKATVDLSPPVGWWDKMRLMVHGQNLVTVTGGGAIKMRVLGSITPYFDPKLHFGTDGVEISISKGIKVDVGGENKEAETLVIECGQLEFSIPNSQYEVRKVQELKEPRLRQHILAQFSGGVRIGIGIEFMTQLTDKAVEIPQTKKHSDVILRIPEYGIDEQTNMIIDSYEDPPVGKPKLGRTIGSVHMKGAVYPLVLSFICEMEDQSSAVGIRCRAEKMDFDMLFEQRTIGSVTDSTMALESIQAKSTQWSLLSSHFEFTELEGRVISFGVDLLANPGVSDMAEEPSMDGRKQPVLIGVDREDRMEWLLDIDFNYVSNSDLVDMIPFIWSPKMIYFRRHENEDIADREKARVDADIFGVQIELFQNRLREIESTIRHYLEMQRALEYRIAVFFDDSLNGQSNLIVEKLAILKEKRDVMAQSIQKCVDRAKENISTIKDSSTDLNSGAVFDHYYIVHNINFLWAREIRNIVFKFFDILQRDSAVRYCLSNAALKTIRELVQSMEKHSRDHLGSLEQDLLKDNVTITNFSQKMAEELLAKLLSEIGSSFTVKNELDQDSKDKKMETPINLKFSEASSANQNAYYPSSDPNSPDFIPDSFVAESNYIIQLINPQVNFQSSPKEDPENLHSVIVAADNMQFRSIGIFDSSDNQSLAMLSARNRSETLIKTRAILNIHNAQFFIARLADMSQSTFSDIDEVFSRTMFHSHKASTLAEKSNNMWPPWVPIECLVDLHSHTGQLQRVVEQTSAAFYRDKPNPLYVKRRKDTSSSISPTSRSGTFTDQTDYVTVHFPEFIISVDSTQYFIVFDIISNLLVYKDPARGERTMRLRKAALAVEQMVDLQQVIDSVLLLQEKIHLATTYLKYGIVSKSSSVSQPSLESILEKRRDTRRSLIQYEDELYIIMEALKAVSIIEQKKKSVGVAWNVQVHANNLEWFMIMDSGKPLAQWTLNHTHFLWMHHEDQSSVNVLEIDKVNVENLLATQNTLRNLISPYTPDSRSIDFARTKMMRLYWREMAPVAGIQVVDHFEINIYPLLLQMTREISKKLELYFFPGNKFKSAQGNKDPAASDDAKMTTDTATTSDVDSHSTANVKGGSSGTSTGSYSGMTTNTNAASNSISSSGNSTLVANPSSNAASVTSSTSSGIQNRSLSPSITTNRDLISRSNTASPAPETPNSAGTTSSLSNSTTTALWKSATALRSSNPTASSSARAGGQLDELKQMQARASENKSFIYVKVPGAQHCLSYRGVKEKNIEDLNLFVFRMPTLEYRNKTWSWHDLLTALKKDAIRAVLANTGALVREKLFQNSRSKPKEIPLQRPDTIEFAKEASGLHTSYSDLHFQAKNPIPLKSYKTVENLAEASAYKNESENDDQTETGSEENGGGGLIRKHTKGLFGFIGTGTRQK